MPQTPKPQTVRNFIVKTLGELSEGDADQLVDDALVEENWRDFVRSFVRNEDSGIQEQGSSESEIRWVTIRIPVLDHLPENGYYARPPRSIGARGPIRLSASQGRGYAAFHLALIELSKTDEPVKIEVAQRGGDRVADQPYDVVRHVFGEIAKQIESV